MSGEQRKITSQRRNLLQLLSEETSVTNLELSAVLLLADAQESRRKFKRRTKVVAKMSIDPKFVELTADVLIIIL